MPYRINCPTCKTTYSVPEDTLGKKLLCKKCGQPFNVGNAKAPAPTAPKPATTGRTTTDLPPRPAAKTPPRRDAVQSDIAPLTQPARRKKSPLVIVGVLAVLLLLVGGAIAGAIVAGIHFLKPRQETPVTQADIQAPSQPATKEDAKPQSEPPPTKAAPATDKPLSPPTPSAEPPPPPDPPVSDRAELPRVAEVGKPFTYQLSRPMEKVRSYTLHNGPKGLKMSKEGLIQWTPEPGQVGSHRLLVGVVTAKISGADIYTVVVAAPGASAARGKGLPADLDRVPRDALAFVSLRLADTLKRPIAAGLRKQLQDNSVLASYKKLLGLEVADIERAVVVFLALKPEVQGVALVTTVKPYERERLLFLIAPEKQEMKGGTATYYVGQKYPAAVHFLNDRTFVVGLGKDVKRFLERPIGKETPGPLSDSLVAATGPQTLIVGVRPRLLIPIEKKDVPPPYQGYLPLLDAKSATLSMDAGQDLRMDLRFAFADEDQAKKGEKAAKEALGMASLIVRQFPETLKKIPIPEFKPLLPKVSALLEAMATALVDTPPQRKALVVEHTMRIRSPDWFNTIVQAAPFLAPRPVKPTPTPSTPPAAPKTPAEAEATIKKLGGQFTRDKKQADAPIVEVWFSRKKLSPDDLAMFGLLTNLKELSLLECGITDEGVKRLAHLVNLERLELVGNNLTDAGLEQLKGLTKLQKLTVSGNEITDAGLVHLKNLTALKTLRALGSVKITDKGLAHLESLKNLEELDVSGDALTGSGLDHLKKLPKLEELALRNNRIRNAELIHLKNIKNLKKLDLTGNFGITDAGLDALKELPQIKEVHLLLTEVTDKGVAELKKALPKADITRR
ncbi:MAG TPA: leucine-rich repeat domain-containing protein [Gemmataceae bacterium]|nr:leucine-rich repeat domain-containing protein [Gemmataceae bacterium]